MLGEMVESCESCAPSGCRACSVRSPCTCQMLGRVVLPSTFALSFHIVLVFLRVSAALLQGAYSHTEKHMGGQIMRQKVAKRERRASSVFAPRPLAGAWCAQVSLQSVRHRSGCDFFVFNLRAFRPYYESCKIFKGRPRRNAFSKMVHRQYKSFRDDRFCHLEMKNPTRLRNKTSNA